MPERVETPVRTIPAVEPDTEPIRRLNPERLCPSQKETVIRTIRRHFDP